MTQTISASEFQRMRARPGASKPMPILFRVFGTPKAQPRPRAFAKQLGGKAVARVYDAGTAEGWKGSIALAARQYVPDEPLIGPLRVDIEALARSPSGTWQKMSLREHGSGSTESTVIPKCRSETQRRTRNPFNHRSHSRSPKGHHDNRRPSHLNRNRQHDRQSAIA